MKALAGYLKIRRRLVLLLAAACCSCSFAARPIYIEDEKKAVEKAVETFHNRINAEQYEVVYDDTHEQFKRANNRETLLTSIRATRERTGKVLQVTEHWVNYIMGDPIPVRAIYNIKCEKGDFSEWFGYAMSKDGKPQLAHYQNFPGRSPAPDAVSK